MLKKMLLIAVIAAMAVTAVGCGANTTSSASASSEATTSESSTEKTTTAEEAAADKAGLKVDEKGNVTDKNGKKVEVKDGKVTVEVDGKKVTIDTEDIKPVTHKTNASTTSKSNSSSATSSKPTSSNTTSKQETTSKSEPTGNTSSKPTTSKPEIPTKPAESKIWHEAVYEYIDHPAVTEQVWVVDTPATTYEEPVYETQWRTICNACGADITGRIDEHIEYHITLGNFNDFSYGAKPTQVQTGTKTVTVPEQGHYETKVVKEAWTEKKLVKEAGYY